MDSGMRRRTLVRGMIGAGALSAGSAAFASNDDSESPAQPGGALVVTEHGVRGDGRTQAAGAAQTILDRVAEQGGGVVVFPAGRYVLEKTLLIPSRVHLVGHGRATVFEGARPNDVNGYALIANAGITDAEGYEGAADFSLQHVAIDSPRTNGIVLVHAHNAYFSNIHGIDAYHHHFDIAGSRNIVVENIFLTGRSGTAPFQIDGNPFNNNIWDGETNISPVRDGTPNDGIFLSNAVIRPTNRPNHGIHLHRDGGRHIVIQNVLLEHLHNGIYRDANCHRMDVAISQVMIRDVAGRGIDFRPTDTVDRRVSFADVTVQDVRGPGFVEYHGCEGLTFRDFTAGPGDATGSQRLALRDVKGGVIDGVQVDGAGSGSAVWLRRCENVLISKVVARNVSRSLRLEDCGGISYSGVCELDRDGVPRELTIEGRDCLTPWQQS